MGPFLQCRWCHDQPDNGAMMSCFNSRQSDLRPVPTSAGMLPSPVERCHPNEVNTEEMSLKALSHGLKRSVTGYSLILLLVSHSTCTICLSRLYRIVILQSSKHWWVERLDIDHQSRNRTLILLIMMSHNHKQKSNRVLINYLISRRLVLSQMALNTFQKTITSHAFQNSKIFKVDITSQNVAQHQARRFNFGPFPCTNSQSKSCRPSGLAEMTGRGAGGAGVLGGSIRISGS